MTEDEIHDALLEIRAAVDGEVFTFAQGVIHVRQLTGCGLRPAFIFLNGGAFPRKNEDD